MHVSFDRAPAYIALSYHWGNPTLSCSTQCNGKEVKITANLHKVLATVFGAVGRSGAPPLYEKNEDIFLWADGICINQKNIEEKNQQVPMMADIYRNSRGTLGYIGAPSAGVKASDTFEAFAHFAGAIIHAADNGLGREGAFKDTIGEELWNSQWYLRSWVTQEVVRPEVMICLFGDEASATTFSIDLLGYLIHQVQIPGRPRMPQGGIRSAQKHIQQAVQVHSWCQLRTSVHQDPSGINLIKILSRLRSAEATDKRDKIYSVLSILKEDDRKAIRVDYAETNTVEQTYTDLARHCISTPDYMRMLEHAGTKRQITGMPTWVPDWSFEPRFPLDSRHYRAAGDTTCNASLSPCGQKIITKALFFDKIMSLGFEVAYPEYKLMNETFAGEHPHGVTIVLEATCQRFCQVVKQRYNRNPGRNSDDPLDQIISRTLTADRGFGDRRATPADVQFYRAFMNRYPPGSLASIQTGDNAVEDSFRPFQVMTDHCQRGRKICLTQGGLLALVPSDSQAGDLIMLLSGGNLPFVLRNNKEHGFGVIGHAYLHGFMDGEVLIRLGALGLTPDQMFSKTIALV
jgi:hypothetical protein